MPNILEIIVILRLARWMEFHLSAVVNYLYTVYPVGYCLICVSSLCHLTVVALISRAEKHFQPIFPFSSESRDISETS